MTRKLLTGALVALTALAAACTPPTAGDMARTAPMPEPEVTTQVTGQTVWDMFPGQGRQGPWNAFAAAKFDQPRGGRPTTIAELRADLVRSNPEVFRSHLARTQFVRAMMAVHPEINSAADIVATLEDPTRHRVVACDARIETLAYNGQGSVKRIARAAVPGEQCVELKVGDQWVAAFSLGCLNPLNARIIRVVEDFCPVTWKVPAGSASADGRSVIVFVPAEAINCLPPASECDWECVQWMRGNRGEPDNPRIAAALKRMVNGGGSAFRLQRGVTEIRLPKAALSDAEYAAWCDRRIHGNQEAYFMSF